MRYLISHKGKEGYRFYWQPPSKLKKLPDKPDWLATKPLGGDMYQAIVDAEKMNAKLDAWRNPRKKRTGGFDGMVQGYMAHSMFTGLKPRTKSDYRQHLEALREDFKGADPQDISPRVVDAYRETLIGKGMSERQIVYRFQVLRRLFRYGQRALNIGENPASKMGLKTAAPRARVWPLPVLQALAMANPYPVGLAIRLALYTLQREGDILAMRWTDMEGENLHVTQGKSGKKLLVPIYPRLHAALDSIERRGDTIIATRHGRPYSGDGFRSVWMKVRKGIEQECSFHDIRATGVSHLKGHGIDDRWVMLMTGHQRTNENLILNVYDRRLGDVGAHVFPVMDEWGV